MISITPNSISIEKYLSINEEDVIKTQTKNDSKFLIDFSGQFFANNLVDICTSVGIEVDFPFTLPLKKSYEQIYGEEIQWIRALGKDRFVKYVSTYLKKTKKEIAEKDPNDYLSVLSKGRKILSSLQRASVDCDLLKDEIKKRDSAILRSLIPQFDNICEEIRYSHGSQTGRMTVASGPKILLLQKEDRKFFKPLDEENVLAQVDFVSLEPRVTYLLTHDSSPRDIYEEMRGFSKSDLPRSKLKIATISSLYGSTHADKNISKLINEFFNLEMIQSRYLNDGRIYNYYGRPLNPESDRVKLSHFIQSTAVDVSLLGMSKFADQNEITPYFMIHDSLVFECSKQVYSDLSKKDLYVDVEPLGRFYLELSKFNEEYK